MRYPFLKTLVFILALGLLSCGESKEEKDKRETDSLGERVARLDKVIQRQREYSGMQEKLFESYERLRISYIGTGRTKKQMDSINVLYKFKEDSATHSFDSLFKVDSIKFMNGY